MASERRARFDSEVVWRGALSQLSQLHRKEVGDDSKCDCRAREWKEQYEAGYDGTTGDSKPVSASSQDNEEPVIHTNVTKRSRAPVSPSIAVESKVSKRTKV